MIPTLAPPTPSAPPSPDGTAQASAPDPAQQSLRQRAIEGIQRRRHYYAELIWSSIVMLVVAIIWAITEYNNAGGWPSNGFSQSSSIPYTWNMWIVYPFIAYGLYLALCSWRYFGRRPISESEIEHEIERHASRR